MSSEINNKNIIIGCTGSVATIKVPQLVQKLQLNGNSVIVAPTKSALHFLKTEAISDKRECYRALYNVCCASIRSDKEPCLECAVNSLYPELDFVMDRDEWLSWNGRGDSVKHIELRNWADVIVIAPLSANSLASIASGLCNNFLLSVLRAWDLKKKVFFCPAMNTHMYLHPFTTKHIDVLKNLGYLEIPAISKTLVCGDTGIGAMAEIDSIVCEVSKYAG